MAERARRATRREVSPNVQSTGVLAAYHSLHDDAGRAERRGLSPGWGAASYANHIPLEVYHVQPDHDVLCLQSLLGLQLHLRFVHLRHERGGHHQRRELQLRQCLQLRHLRLRPCVPLQRVMMRQV